MLVIQKRHINKACQWTGDNVKEMREHLGDVDPKKLVGEIKVPWEPKGKQVGDLFIFQKNVFEKNDWALTSGQHLIRVISQEIFKKQFSTITITIKQ